MVLHTIVCFFVRNLNSRFSYRTIPAVCGFFERNSELVLFNATAVGLIPLIPFPPLNARKPKRLRNKMTGRSKGVKLPLGKGITTRSGGRGGAKRHRKVLRDNIQGITKSAIRRLARRGGVKRIAGGIYDETREVLKNLFERRH
jgi:hypothetical protein